MDTVPTTVLEAIKAARYPSWSDLARDIAKAGAAHSIDASYNPRHITRVAQLKTPAGPRLAKVLEFAFGQQIACLLSPYDPATFPALVEHVPNVHHPHQEALTMAADRARNFGRDLPHVEDLSAIEDEIRTLARAYPVKALPDLLNPLITLQETTFDALENPKRPSDGRHLYTLAGVVCGILAKASHDLGDPQAALGQARTAYLCGGQANNDSIRAWVRGLQSLVLYWDGQTRESIRYARMGVRYANGTTMAAWLASSEARAWAKLRNTEEAVSAVHRAEHALENSQDTYLDDFGGLLTFTRERQLYYASDAFAWLPTHPEAQAYAAEAVRAYSDPSSEAWAFGDAAGSQCDQAIVRIKAGEIDGAAEAVAPVLELPRGQRIGGIVKSVKHVQDALAQAPDSVVGDDLDGELEAFTRAPLRMQP